MEQLENESEVVKYLEKEQLSVFLKIALDQGLFGDYIIFLVLAYSGIRYGELCALKWTDFDFDNHTLSITKTYYNPTNNILDYQLLTPKTTTSKRKIELSPIIFTELKKHQKLQKEYQMLYKKTYHDKKFVFFNKEEHPGYPLYIKFIGNRMRRLLKLAELDPKLTPHSLRHTTLLYWQRQEWAYRRSWNGLVIKMMIRPKAYTCM
ncbi:site-specific integrase [Paenibacillus agricola]|uniref:site-specific integrase n=1 Tax=Paenibacillus agricola TaxID=2716264 RepID=UPI0028931D06|nr:site-specific integrase [Paenibacillus agricola]